jgi:hypothetical protein
VGRLEGASRIVIFDYARTLLRVCINAAWMRQSEARCSIRTSTTTLPEAILLSLAIARVLPKLEMERMFCR